LAAPVEPSRAPEGRSGRPAAIRDEDLIAALRRNAWRQKPTAEELGIARNTLVALMERCPLLRRPVDLGPDEIVQAWAEHRGRADRAAAALEVSEHGLKLRIRELGLD